MSDPRNTSRYRKARSAFLKRSDKICHWCGCQVFDTVPPRHPRKATVDHLVEVDRASTMAYDITLWVVACNSCNSSRGATYGNTKTARTPSREW